MTDELDVLRHEHDVIEPDPQFRADLMDRLRQDMAAGDHIPVEPLILSGVAPGSRRDDAFTEPVDVVPAARVLRGSGARWLVAVAAAVALLVAAVALTMLDDDQDVDTTPPMTEAPDADEVSNRPLPSSAVQVLDGREVVSGSGCPFGISGDGVDLQPGPIGAFRFEVDPGQGAGHILLGAQTAEVRVPGHQVGASPDWDIQPVDLGGGRSATVWLNGPASAGRGGVGNLPFVQVDYFPGGDEPCSSFSVSVDGGTVESNRQVAEDLAARVLLPADMSDLDLPGSEGGPVAGLELPGTTWVIDGSFPTRAEMTFSDTTVQWDDGCATVTADYELDRDEGFLTLSNRTSSDPGCTPEAVDGFTFDWSKVAAVMAADPIDIGLVNGRLRLGSYPGDSHLDLGLPDPHTSSMDPARVMPEPGPQQPADAAAAEEEVRTAFLTFYDATLPVEERAEFVDRPEVWIPAVQALQSGPYGGDVSDLHAEVDEVVFTSPTHAAVLFRVYASSPTVPNNDQIGDAWFIDGRWVVDVFTPCYGMSLANVVCDVAP